MSESLKEELPRYVRARIERNRQKAITLKRSKLMPHPYAKEEAISKATTTIIATKIVSTKYKDTGGGFLLEEEADKLDPPDRLRVEIEAPILKPDRPACEICNKPFATSWLFDKFRLMCCDTCRDPEIHKLVTKTEAKESYLLKDCDFDKREPPLKCIKQKNPHNEQWGYMKLYLQIQVEKRALEVWGIEEKIEEEREQRAEKKVSAKSKKYENWVKKQRKEMFSSLYYRTNAASHTHEFHVETYNEEDDAYHRMCTTCPYEETFEKI